MASWMAEPRSSGVSVSMSVRLVDRAHAEHVVHEVGVRAAGPRLDPGRRDRRGERRDGGGSKVAVVLGEARRSARASRSRRARRRTAIVGGRAGGRACRRRRGRASTARGRGARPPTPGTAVAASPWAWESIVRRASRVAGGERAGRSSATGGASAVARRSPRGTVTSDAGVVVTAARNWRWTSGGPLVGALQAGDAARSWSPSSGSTVGRRRDEPVGGAEDDGEVDVEAGGAGERADVDAVADLAAGGPA